MSLERRTWVIGFCAAAALAAVVAPPAIAGNFTGANGRTGCSNGSPVNMADNRDHYFWYENVTSAVSSAVNYTRTNVYNPTVINTHNDSSNKSTTDVVVRDEDYSTYCGYSWHGSGGSLWGLTTCDSTNSASECEKHTVRYDLSYFNAAGTTDERGLACHETGHTLGLTHRDTDSRCMKTFGPYPTTLAGHDVNHLTNNY